MNSLDRLRWDLEVDRIAHAATRGLAQRLADDCWCAPTGWRRVYAIAVGLLIFPFALPLVALELADAWPELDAWERLRAGLGSIYALIFAALWCWGMWELLT